jgi:methylated-DNA-[protein]-cysteine S-methyltransferase
MTTLEQQLKGFAPQARPPVFDTADVAYAVTETPIGRMLLARNQAGALVASTFVPDDTTEAAVVDRLAHALSPRVLRLPRALDDARRQLEEYFTGQRHGFDLTTDLVLATPFQRSVLTALRTVGYGERATYGKVATLIDRPAASRAVGTALGSNPLCVVLPCHRVVGSTGRLTGYAGGVAAKKFLLDLEGPASRPEHSAVTPL